MNTDRHSGTARAFLSLVRGVSVLWSQAGIVLLLLVALELLLSLLFGIFGAPEVAPPTNLDLRAESESYVESEWGEQLIAETRAIGIPRWYPYTYWRRPSYEGELVTIDPLRHRWTFNESNLDETGRDKQVIFMFGGSTMWGEGVRNEHTIPSLVSRELSEMGFAVEVVNFGENGYVSTQELIALFRELQQGHVPNIVIFYDGVNDAFSTLQNGVAGLSQNERNRQLEFNLLHPLRNDDRWLLVLEDVGSKFALWRFAKTIRSRLSPKGGPVDAPAAAAPSAKPKVDADLVRRTWEMYAAVVRNVRHLGSLYGFKSHFYWQPTIFEKNEHSRYETMMAGRAAPYQAFIESTYSLARSRIETSEDSLGVVDLSQIFAERSEPVFLDWNHISEAGNAVVAKRIIEDLLQKRSLAQ